GLEHRPRLGVRGVDDPPHLLVDGARDLRRVLGATAASATEHRVDALPAVSDGPEPGAHPVLGDHGPGDPGRLLDVRARSRGGLAEHVLLGGASAIAMTMRASISARVMSDLSSSGTTRAWPPVRPRARIVTLWTGSRSSMAHAASACPDSW